MRRIGSRSLPLAAIALALPACIPSVDQPAASAPPPRYQRDAPPPPRLAVDETDLAGERAAPPLPLDELPPSRTPRRPRTAPSRPAGQPNGAPAPVVALPAPRPAWEARPVAADARVVADSTYVVASGDTLNRIADRTGAAADAIARANARAVPFGVRAGQRLRIPAGRYHFIRDGQTGIAIARAYGVEWSRIVTANALAEPYTLRVGQRLAIPQEATGATRAAERAAAFTLDVEDLVTGAQPAQVASAPQPRAAPSATRVLPATTPIQPPARLAGGFLWPVDGRIVRRFGAGASGDRSDGIKIAVPMDTPIRAAADGVVAYVGDGIAALGGLVIVKHGDGWTSVYGHAHRLLVRRGQSVKRGQTIALSGDTGYADRPELHFELRKGRAAIDPLRELPRT